MGDDEELHCKELEENMRTEPLVDFTNMIQPLSDELNKVLESIRKNIFLELPIVTELIPDKIMSQLHELEKTLTDHNPEAINLLNEIGMIRGFEKQIEKLKKVLVKYDFGSAMKILADLKSQIFNYMNC